MIKKSITIIMFSFLLSINGIQAGGTGKAITFTTMDVKANYDIIQIITGFSEIASPGGKDNFMKAYSAAWTTLSAEASKVKADAVVGIHVEFLKSNDGFNDKVVVYGTAVRYR